MKTEVIMKREIFGNEISQSSKTGFFNATELKHAGDKWRIANGLPQFNLAAYLNSKSTKEFVEELEKKYSANILTTSRGRSSATWVHPLLFIDIALAISPKLKIEVYEWIFDNLIKFRNDSGDSYRDACGALYTRCTNLREFPDFIQKTANRIKAELGVKDWQTATELQLKQRDKCHVAIKLYSNVLTNINQIVTLALDEAKKINSPCQKQKEHQQTCG
jgi:hypothetical protein